MGAEPNITGVTRGGTAWIPQFAVALDEGKLSVWLLLLVCPRDVLTIVQRAVDDVDFDDDDDDDDDDSDNSFMTLTNPMDCIGCEACSRVCPKARFTHEALPVAA